MKFCKDCKKLYDGADTICTDCNKKYSDIADINEPVQLCVVGGVERNLVTGALRDAQIPFVEKQYGQMGVANEIVTGYDAKLLNISIEVPYSAVPKAYDAIKGVGIDNDAIECLLDKINADIDKYKQTMQSDDTEMSVAKRTTVKVLSAIAFIILAALVIFGTDYLMELLKNLLGG